jgi:hypothetical protein
VYDDLGGAEETHLKVLEADVAKIAVVALLFCGTILCAQTQPSDIIGAIDFYGYQGLDVARVRAALPVQAGSPITQQTRSMIETAVAEVTGKKPTDVSMVCCDRKGRSLIYMGLHGETNKGFALNPVPTGTERLPPEAVKLWSRIGDALEAAVKKGNAEEDDSQGYALQKDPAMRALQMQARTWALAHGPELLQVLRDSAYAKQREIASYFLGYAKQSHEQLAALVYASRDSDSGVRNNATRALGVLVASNEKLEAEIEPGTFLAMLGSGIWTDHNKAVGLLTYMTNGRDSQLLAKIRAEALVPLIEMARWSDQDHAAGARLILGRVAGIPEDKLESMVRNGPADAIIEAASSSK